MRPTVFAELAASELLAGTSICRGSDHVFYKFIAMCPRCAAPSPADTASEPVVDLHDLTLRDLAWTHLGNSSPAAEPPATRLG